MPHPLAAPLLRVLTSDPLTSSEVHTRLHAAGIPATPAEVYEALAELEKSGAVERRFVVRRVGETARHQSLPAFRLPTEERPHAS